MNRRSPTGRLGLSVCECGDSFPISWYIIERVIFLSSKKSSRIEPSLSTGANIVAYKYPGCTGAKVSFSFIKGKHKEWDKRTK